MKIYGERERVRGESRKERENESERGGERNEGGSEEEREGANDFTSKPDTLLVCLCSEAIFDLTASAKSLLSWITFSSPNSSRS